MNEAAANARLDAVDARVAELESAMNDLTRRLEGALANFVRLILKESAP